MKLLAINYDNPGVPEMFDDSNTEKVQEWAAMVDEGNAYLFKFENGAFFQAMVEKDYTDVEPESEEEEGDGTEQEVVEEAPFTWVLSFGPAVKDA